MTDPRPPQPRPPEGTHAGAGDGSASGPGTDRPTDEIARAADAAALPGTHRGGFAREFTAPTQIVEPVHAAVEWAPAPAAPLPRAGGWALMFAVLGLAVSFIVGWGFPIGILGVILAIIALRRPWESRPMAVWALCLSTLSLIYSAGWLWWAWSQGDLFA